MSQTDLMQDGQVPPHLHMALTDETASEWVAGIYQFNDPQPVSGFLRRHPFLVNLLIDAWPRIQSCFGSDAQAALELFKDPEEVNGEGKLFVLVQTSLPANEALNRLEKLDQDWWLDATARSQGRLNIDVEYV